MGVKLWVKCGNITSPIKIADVSTIAIVALIRESIPCDAKLTTRR